MSASCNRCGGRMRGVDYGLVPLAVCQQCGREVPWFEDVGMDYLPIKKVVAAFVAAGISLAARAAGVDLGPELVNQAAMAVVTVGAAYVVRDPRVRALTPKSKT